MPYFYIVTSEGTETKCYLSPSTTFGDFMVNYFKAVNACVDSCLSFDGTRIKATDTCQSLGVIDGCYIDFLKV